ncbi:hypothetical protein AGOR_G00007910 [Albula goreensis]|uniref:UBA domain-containing protein n=1 Tax=Albula goreensis TaxID=1534307 RepID=A0A8T3E908_9TELE|nr:hypothetical protein AGOR_G00007910 [Albula goreensis]
MMTSVGSERSRGTRDKALPATTQTTQSQKQIQATAEQIRLAQMIYDKSDVDFEDKVKQLIEVTGKNQDECMVALHDCNEDVNRAINFLLEGSSDVTSWETVGKKRGLGKDGSSSENKENKDNREKRAEREASRGRGGPSRRGRGASRSREVRVEENGVDSGTGERGSDRGRRGRGRGSGGRGRGRTAGGSRFSAQGMGTFNPADYTSDSGAGGSNTETWETGANDSNNGTGAWKSTMEDWAAEDWNEDLSETKVFTASVAPATENHVTPGQSLVSLLQKPGAGGEQGCLEPPSPQSMGNNLVFTNSHHHRNGTSISSSGTAPSYAHAALSSVLGSGFGDLSGPKPSPSAGAQILEQLKGPGLGQLPTQPPNSGSTVGATGVAGVPVSTSAWDIKPLVSQSTVALSSQFSRDFKIQPEPSLVLSQMAQRQQNSLSQPGPLPVARQPSPPTLPTPSPLGLESFSKPLNPSPTHDGSSANTKLLSLLPTGVETQSSSSQHKQMKTQKRRVQPTSKIPSSAVEMPGSADVSGLNVQFGALDFGSEPALQDFGQPENCTSSSAREPVPISVPQTPNSLYSNPISESLGTPLSLPLASSDPSYPSSSVSLSSLATSLGPPSAGTPPSSSSSVGNSFDSAAPHSRLAFSQNKDTSAAPVTNGFNGVRTPTTLDTSSNSSTPKPDSPSLTSASSAPAPASLLPLSVPAHSSALPNLTPELPSATPPPSAALCPAITQATASHPAQPSPQPPLSQGPGLSGNGTTVPSACRTTPLLSSSGKAPPNLPQGVPPLLPNQYIMGPGGLLPAYPQIYGYEDLHMLQSRLPMDYYGITFPGPTATLAGRDGTALANSPYSGEVTKFGRADSASPAPPTSLSAAHAPQPPQAQSQSQQQQGQQQPPQQQGHHSTQQAFLNPALPPGYSYTGLPYYPGVPGVPSAFQYGPTMFVPPASAKQHGVSLSNPSTPFQQPSGYGQHTYSSGYDDLTQAQAGGDYSKGDTAAPPKPRPNLQPLAQGKVSQLHPAILEFQISVVLFTTKPSHLTNRVFMLGRHRPSACPRHWEERDP